MDECDFVPCSLRLLLARTCALVFCLFVCFLLVFPSADVGATGDSPSPGLHESRWSTGSSDAIFFLRFVGVGEKNIRFFRPFFRRFPTGRLESNFVFPPSCNEIPRCRFFFFFFYFFWFRSPTTRSSQRSMAALEIGGQTSGRPDAGPISSQVSISFRFLISNLFLFILKCDFTRGFPCVTTSQYNNVKENIRVKK